MSAWEFHVGQRVVCAYADFNSGPSPLREGGVYTIQAIGEGRGVLRGVIDTYQVLALEEVENVHHFDRCFAASRFRPLRERKTSIECFRALLNTTEKKVEA